MSNIEAEAIARAMAQQMLMDGTQTIKPLNIFDRLKNCSRQLERRPITPDDKPKSFVEKNRVHKRD